jgi:hypothetical protein
MINRKTNGLFFKGITEGITGVLYGGKPDCKQGGVNKQNSYKQIVNSHITTWEASRGLFGAAALYSFQFPLKIKLSFP